MITTPLAAGQAPPWSEHQWSTHHHLWSRAAWLNLHKFIANIIESICICLVFAFCFTCAFMYTSTENYFQSISINQSINQSTKFLTQDLTVLCRHPCLALIFPPSLWFLNGKGAEQIIKTVNVFHTKSTFLSAMDKPFKILTLPCFTTQL